MDDLRVLLRLKQGRAEQPSAVIMDSRTLQSSPESGGRAGYDGGKRKKGSKVHIAVDTLGHLLALCVTSANQQDRELVQELAQTRTTDYCRSSGSRVCRRWLYRRAIRCRCCCPRNSIGSRQASRGKKRICTTAAPLDSRA